jgi:hypothetical protein
LPAKAANVWNMLKGDSLHGWAVRDDGPHSTTAGASNLERVSLRLSDLWGRSRRAYLDVALACSLPVLLFVNGGRERRLILFLMVALAVGLTAMLLTYAAGGTIHHLALLWPLPHALIAVAAAWLWRRRFVKPVVIILVSALAATNILVINEFYALMLRNGGTPRWTNAIYGVAEHFKRAPAKAVVLLDWGLLCPLRILSRGTLPLDAQMNILDESVPAKQWDTSVTRLLSDPGTVFLTNVEPQLPGAVDRLDKFAAERHFVRTPSRFFHDSRGRPMIEAFAYRSASP